MNELSPQALPKNLANALEALGMSNADLAQRTGLDKYLVDAIVSGGREPDMKTLCLILQAVPITFHRLVR